MIELQPVLQGPTLTLRPLRADDFDALHAAASDPLIWEVHPEPTRWQHDVFRKFFDAGIESKGAFVVIDRATDRIIGSSRYYEWKPETREIAIGFTFLARSHWGGTTNREMKKLMLDHIFPWADIVWFHVGQQNWRSRKAMEKIGGIFSHYAPVELAGVMHNYAYYKIERPIVEF
jgi:RimJ/RimL family protein N-acetyltransferase